ncbi:MAG TPA: glycosyltransferase family 2 protein, partial [Actinomycetota bacterium]|nr:glycosyltransferase family 2 protein [Actinomycetota bacterium]
MARAEIGASHATATAEPTVTSNVLVVLVSRDGRGWLRRCLASLARQTYERLGVVAVDNDSTDGSAELLEASLGADRVVRLAENRGFPGAVAEALRLPAASKADHVLLLHDDTLLAPEAISRLVEASRGMDGGGVVGPKILDAEDPKVLSEIGLSADRFGYPFSPLEKDEIDQGQYDRVREVLYVSSAAMLVSREVFERIGGLDERFVARQEDLDFCWRARLAGFRVLWTPRAVALHRGATVRGERVDTTVRVGVRYHRERAAVASMLKNYGVFSLSWMLPLALVQGVVRVALFLLARRFEDAFQVVAAWGWNLTHLPGTIRRRVRAQSVRRVRDHRIRQFMAPSWIRLGRWSRRAAEALRPVAGDDDESSGPLPGARLRRIVGSHPVASAWTIATVIALIAYRHLSGASPLVGGALARFPSAPFGFFGELVSGIRHTGLGGTAPASPALGILGVGSVLTFGSPPLLQKALLLVLPAVAGVTAYRGLRSLGVERVPGVLAASCYALSAAVLWGVSDGRLPELIFLAALPWVATRLSEAFGPLNARPVRWVVGTGLGLAVVGSFFPGLALAAAVVIGVSALIVPKGGGRAGGAMRVAAAAAVAAALAAPVIVAVVRSGGAGLADAAGTTGFGDLLRLSLGPAPGAWRPGFFLPLAAALGLAFVSGAYRVAAGRAVLAGVASVYLAWAAAAGWLPSPLANPVAYVGVAALSFTTLVALGLDSLASGVARTSFGYRQVGSGLMIALVSFGLVGQSVQAMQGSWAVGGPERLPPAYQVIGSGSPPAYRVLWVGRRVGGALPAPGGLPDGHVAVGPASVRFAVTGTGGASALDVGRAASGPGYDRLRA